MLNRRENNPLDALELMRHAVQRSPENREYRLDLAEMYCEMGCYKQSNRLLLDLLAEEDAPSECYFGLAINQMGQNDMDGAYRLLKKYKRIAPNDVNAHMTDQLLQELNILEILNHSLNRRAARAVIIAVVGSQTLLQGDTDRAEKMLSRSLEMLPGQQKMRAVHAASLMMSGENERALQEARRACDGSWETTQALCIASQVFAGLNRMDEAGKAVNRAMELHPVGEDLRVLICTLAELGMHEEVAECARLMLQDKPYDRQILHMRAVALHLTGKSDDQTAQFWRRITRIDPDDTIAQYYLEACCSNQLAQCNPDYTYEVPEDEIRRRMHWLSDQLDGGLDGVRERWQSDPVFRQLIQWAVCSEKKELRRIGVTVISAVDDPTAQSMVRAMLFNGDITDHLRVHVISLMRLRGVDLKTIFPTESSEESTELPDPEQRMRDTLVGERQMRRYAGQMLESVYDIDAQSSLILIWMTYRRFRGISFNTLTDSEAAAGALVYVYLSKYGRARSEAEIALRFECSNRRMHYYIERIMSALERSEGVIEDENI